MAEQEIEDKAVKEASERAGEAKLCEWLDGLFTEASQARKTDAKEDMWDDWNSGFWGEQWKSPMPSYKPPIVVNELKTLILTEVSDITDDPPKIFVTKDPIKGDRDKDAEEFMRAFWIKEQVDLQVMLAFLDSMIIPAGFLTCVWDPTRDFGKGNIVVSCRDPKSVYPDPDAVDDESWRYCFFEDFEDVVYIRKRWPIHGERVEPDSAYSSGIVDAKERRGSSGKYSGPMSGMDGSEGTEFSKGRARILTLFIEDDETEDTTEEYEEEGEKKLRVVERKKYPNGRMIQKAGNVILYDGPTIYSDRLVPCIRIIAQPSPHMFWPPESPLSGVLEVTRAANKMDSMVVENGIRLNVGERITDDSSIDPKTEAAIPGSTRRIRPGSKYDIKYPPPMPADMINGGERFRGFTAKVLGFTPARIGSGTKGNVSAELTETEISQTMGLSRLRARLLHNSMQKLVSMMFARMAQFYTTDRMIPNISGGDFRPIKWKPISESDKYGAHVDPSSFQIKSKTMLQRLYLTLGKMGKIPDGTLLEILEIPDHKEVAKQLAQQLQLMAQAGLAKQKGKGK